MSVTPGRRTHEHEGELVVFLIGMTVNRLWRPDLWIPVFRAMPPMLTELSTDPESGLMGYRLTVGRGGPVLVQYWSSIDKLYHYASDRTAAHRPAWAEFNRRARQAPGAVGIWHETFVVDRAESMYVDTPVGGLAGATQSVPVRRGADRAKDRLGQTPRSGRGGAQER
ncbi:DUF4188 domain-containing protein [Microbacterium sp. P07]|uniref:DUF4188 domain-containing protein n=1 Tax=Microbacterium sp. P07 TaxID=3366952 RepID=UPI003746045B